LQRVDIAGFDAPLEQHLGPALYAPDEESINGDLGLKDDQLFAAVQRREPRFRPDASEGKKSTGAVTQDPIDVLRLEVLTY
jgi:hypothetical protein